MWSNFCNYVSSSLTVLTSYVSFPRCQLLFFHKFERQYTSPPPTPHSTRHWNDFIKKYELIYDYYNCNCLFISRRYICSHLLLNNCSTYWSCKRCRFPDIRDNIFYDPYFYLRKTWGSWCHPSRCSFFIFCLAIPEMLFSVVSFGNVCCQGYAIVIQ